MHALDEGMFVNIHQNAPDYILRVIEMAEAAYNGFEELNGVLDGAERKELEFAKTIVEAGFKPPDCVCVKVDPRGKEYGKYEAEISTGQCPGDKRIRLIKRAPGGYMLWECFFKDPIAFLAWARENT